MVFYLLVVGSETPPTPSASSGVFERLPPGCLVQREPRTATKTVVDSLEVQDVRIFRASGAGAGLEDALPIQRTSAILLLAAPSELGLEGLNNFLDADAGLGAGVEAVRVLCRNGRRRSSSFCCPSLEGKCEPGSGTVGFYTVILLCRDQEAADALYKANHGRLFPSAISSGRQDAAESSGPCCYLAFLEGIVYDDVASTRSLGYGAKAAPPPLQSEECRTEATPREVAFDADTVASVIPGTASELPSCPLCLERIDVSGTGMVTHSQGWLSAAAGELGRRSASCEACAVIDMVFASMRAIPETRSPEKGRPPLSCPSCEKKEELWVCMVCGHLGCGRYAQGHAKDHATEKRHRFCFDLTTGRIWDYAGDVFVHRRLVQMAAVSGGLFELAMPAPADGAQGGGNEPAASGSKAFASHEQVLSMELDAILASRLDHQRSLYETQLAELSKQHALQVAKLRTACEAEDARCQSLKDEAREAQKRQKALERQLASAERARGASEEQLGFAKELNQSLLANRREIMAKSADASAAAPAPEKCQAEDPLVQRLREKVRVLMEQVSALDGSA